jgi:hypothetical protein
MAQGQNPERVARIAQQNEIQQELWERIVVGLQEQNRWNSTTMGYRMTDNDHEEIFSCPQVCMQCVGWKANGQQCTRSTCKYLPVCHSHALSLYNVAVRDTNTPAGLGLYAKNRRQATGRAMPLFLPNDVVCPYIAEKFTLRDLNDRYPGDITATYGWSDPNWGGPNIPAHLHDRRPTWDGACMRGLGNFANSDFQRVAAVGQRPRGFVGINARIIRSRLGWPIIQAIQPIFDGQEITVDYGEDYAYNDAHHRTGRGRYHEVDISWPYNTEIIPNFQLPEFGSKTRKRKRSTKKNKKNSRRKRPTS